MPQNILVTGGAGYIGAHTCKALALAGFCPVTYDNFSTGHPYAIKWGPVVQGDLRCKETLNQAFAEFRPLAVFHFASYALVGESMENPGKYYSHNLESSVKLFEVMRDHGCQFLIFSSTCATYGAALYTPIDENHPQNPINPYGKSKWMIEQILSDFDQAHGLKSVCLRYFNAAGADIEGEIGEDHTPETHLIPSLLETALGQRPFFSVYGTHFPTPDGSAIRDYAHVQDLADAHLLALQYVQKKNTTAAFNLGTGHGYSVLEILHHVEEWYQKKLEVRFENQRKGDPATLTANPHKAKKILGWSPHRSNLKTLIASAARWQEKKCHTLLLS